MMSLLKSLVPGRGCSSRRFIRAALIIAAIVQTAIVVRPVSAELIYGIANQAPASSILVWDSATPNNIISGAFVSGLQPNETILGIDFRPATGQLYALGSTSRLYTLDPTTGVASAVAASFAPPALSGFSYGFDFNPVIDRIRVVAETNQNLVLNPDTGTVQTIAPNVAYALGDPNVGVDPNVVHSAYTNNFPGAASTTLFGIDTGIDVLVTQNAATGALSTVGPLLTVNAAAAGGFDISGTTGTAYAALTPIGGSVSNLYTVNLATGTAILVGAINGGVVITAITVAPIPEPSSAVLLIAGLAVGFIARRRR
jgi:hypothetical protein